MIDKAVAFLQKYIFTTAAQAVLLQNDQSH
jgi:hypothetical protein